MSIANLGLGMRPFCKGCRNHKPIAGGTMKQHGKGFRCRDCRLNVVAVVPKHG